jgi:hypothetical protein
MLRGKMDIAPFAQVAKVGHWHSRAVMFEVAVVWLCQLGAVSPHRVTARHKEG